MSENSVNYKSVLGDLRMRRARLDAAILAIEDILGEPPDKPTNRGIVAADMVERAIHAPSGAYADMTIAASAIHYLGTVGKTQNTRDIAEALKRGGLCSTSKNLYRTLYNTLNNRLDKEITKNGSKWGLKTWQQ